VYQAKGAGDRLRHLPSPRSHRRALGIDVMVSTLHQMANDREKALGNALVRWLMNNFAKMHLNYVIWFNQMNDGAGGSVTSRLSASVVTPTL
jgi:hypothetical protein